eukprot:1157710-Pelagomonas_calceolata.AAC.5
MGARKVDAAGGASENERQNYRRTEPKKSEASKPQHLYLCAGRHGRVEVHAAGGRLRQGGQHSPWGSPPNDAAIAALQAQKHTWFHLNRIEQVNSRGREQVAHECGRVMMLSCIARREGDAHLCSSCCSSDDLKRQSKARHAQAG